ncbi:hypothetical protein DIPPA_25988, partial [Diplonema papillatum]
MYENLEEAEVAVEQPLEEFKKLKACLLQLCHGNLQLRKLVVALHDRALDVKHGTASKVEGFFSPQIMADVDRFLYAKNILRLRAVSEEPAPDDPRTKPFDVRTYLTMPMLTASPDAVDEFFVVDDTAAVTDVFVDLASVSLKVWADLEKQYHNDGGKPGSPLEGDAPRVAASPHIKRALE